MDSIHFNQRRTKLKPKIIAFFICLSLVFVFSGCSGDTPADAVKAAMKKKAAAENEKTDAEKAGKTLIAGKGNIVSMTQFKFIIPEDWTCNSDTQVCYPKDQASRGPLPPVSLHHGGHPMMGISALKDGVKRHAGVDFQVVGKKNMGGMEGLIARYQRGKYKNIGLFLMENNPGVNILHFFTCQAPADSFDQYLKVYQAILDSVTM